MDRNQHNQNDSDIIIYEAIFVLKLDNNVDSILNLINLLKSLYLIIFHSEYFINFDVQNTVLLL